MYIREQNTNLYSLTTTQHSLALFCCEQYFTNPPLLKTTTTSGTQTLLFCYTIMLLHLLNITPDLGGRLVEHLRRVCYDDDEYYV